MKRASIITLLTMMTLSIMAIPAKREAVKVAQPDGTTLTIRLHGDEWQHFTTTSDGYTVIKDKQGYYVYAQRQGDVLKATNMVAHDEQNRKGGVSGFGLGLNYVDQVMQAHGGKVTVASEKDKYSEFTLYIPKSL